MKIQGKIKADMVGFKPKHNKENDARFAYVELAMNCDQKRLTELFGSELNQLVFGSMEVTSGGEGEQESPSVRFGYTKATPSAIFEQHQIHLCGHGPLSVQPSIKKIEPIKDEEKVKVTLQVPILLNDNQELAGALVIQYGKVVDVDFNPHQAELPLQGGVTMKRGGFGNPQPVVN